MGTMLKPLIDMMDRVRARPDYPAGVTLAEFTEYMDRITGCEVAGNGMKIKHACEQWTTALDRDNGS